MRLNVNSEDTVRTREMLIETVLRYDTVSFTLGGRRRGGRRSEKEKHLVTINNWSMHKTYMYLHVSTCIFTKMYMYTSGPAEAHFLWSGQI